MTQFSSAPSTRTPRLSSRGNTARGNLIPVSVRPILNCTQQYCSALETLASHLNCEPAWGGLLSLPWLVWSQTIDDDVVSLSSSRASLPRVLINASSIG